MDRKPLDVNAVGIMVLLCAAISTQQVAIKLAEAGMAPVLQIGMRSALAALAVSMLIALRREAHLLSGPTWRPGLLAGALFGIEFVLLAQGLRLTSASHIAVFLYTGPIFAALCLHFRFASERLGRLQWGGIALAFAGVALAFSGRPSAALGAGQWLGDLLGIAAGLAFGLTTLVVRASRLGSAPPTVTLWYQLVGGAVFGVAGAFLLGQTAVTPGPALFLNLAYQGLVVSTICYLGWFAMLRTYPASRIGVLSLMTPIFGLGLGVVLLGDALSRNFLAGAGLIILGLSIVSARDALAGLGRAGRPPLGAGG